ncbi:MAG: hypothetical protein HY703_01310, partial [Gemmatimonadetes bacterium]|nr:hypothetical protein [Gemmatimonadota bacterium]
GVRADTALVTITRWPEELRILLSWTAALDLDAHERGPVQGGGQFHVFWGDKGSPNAAPYAFLDGDIETRGTETITLTRQIAGTYRFTVHNYTDRRATPSSPSSRLGASGAVVEVSRRGVPVARYTVPNQAGTHWTVFDLSGTTITPVNTVTYETNPFNASVLPGALRGAAPVPQEKSAAPKRNVSRQAVDSTEDDRP